MHTIKQILSHLPKITSNGLDEVVHIIQQSRKFDNYYDKTVADNEFELRYANYLGTQDNKFIDYYQTIVEQACFSEFLEWYEYLSKHILRKDVQEVLGIDFDYTSSDWELEVKKSDIFGWAFRNKDRQNYINNIHKVAELGSIMVKFFNQRKPLSIIDNDYFDADHAQLVLDSIQKVIIDKDRSELVNQLHSDKVLCMIEVYGWENRFNPILLNWIFYNQDKVKNWV
jgi:hypothetical protein